MGYLHFLKVFGYTEMLMLPTVELKKYVYSVFTLVSMKAAQL